MAAHLKDCSSAILNTMVSDRLARREIVQFGRMMHERGYVSAMDGNLSVRLDEERILCTPTAMCKGMMRPQDLVIVDPDADSVRIFAYLDNWTIRSSGQ